MIAILVGIFFGNVFQVRNAFQKGLDFTREYILKLWNYLSWNSTKAI